MLLFSCHIMSNITQSISSVKLRVQCGEFVTVRPPAPATVDGRNVFAFDGRARLFGDFRASLVRDEQDIPRPYSVFAAVKVTDTVSSEQVIFALDAGGSLRLGVTDGKLTVRASRVHTPATAEIVSEGCFSGRCLKMQHRESKQPHIPVITGPPRLRTTPGQACRSTCGGTQSFPLLRLPECV